MGYEAKFLGLDSPKDAHHFCRARIFDSIEFWFPLRCKVQYVFMQRLATRTIFPKKLHARTNFPIPSALYDKGTQIFCTPRPTMKPKFLSWIVQRLLINSAGSDF